MRLSEYGPFLFFNVSRCRNFHRKPLRALYFLTTSDLFRPFHSLTQHSHRMCEKEAHYFGASDAPSTLSFVYCVGGTVDAVVFAPCRGARIGAADDRSPADDQPFLRSDADQTKRRCAGGGSGIPPEEHPKHCPAFRAARSAGAVGTRSRFGPASPKRWMRPMIHVWDFSGAADSRRGR